MAGQISEKTQYTVVILALLLQVHQALGNALPSQFLSRSSDHPCSVFVQRWFDNSFDVYDYAFAPPAGIYGPYIITVESISLQAGEALPPSTVGSHILNIINVANPVSPNDPGQLSFSWGSTTWDSSSCTVHPTGEVGAEYGAATTYSCDFACDA